MARVDADAFENKEVSRIYIAGKTSEAKRVERILTEGKVDYAFEIEPYMTSLLGLFPATRNGVAFYVESSRAEFSRSELRKAGLRVGLVDESFS